jgi:hypothetical protein
MGSSLPVGLVPAEDAEIGFVDQSGRLKSVLRPLTTHEALSQAMKLAVELLEQPLLGFAVP